LGNPAFTSLFQSGVRWNAFVVLAAAEQFTGEASLGAIAVAIAVLIPSINITCIVVLSTFGPRKATPIAIVKSVLKNPLVQACLVGLALYFSGVSLPVPVTEALELVGRGALAVGLLAIGAGISLRRLARWNWNVALAAVMRPLAGPVIFAGIAFALDLTPLQTFAGVMIFAAPAASNGYILAKQMGGDADLYADVLTWQTLLSLIMLPLWAGVLLG
jgi:predicted permease